jgi:hypothetical protein
LSKSIVTAYALVALIVISSRITMRATSAYAEGPFFRIAEIASDA